MCIRDRVGQAFDVLTENLAPDVVGVVVRGQDADQPQAPRL